MINSIENTIKRIGAELDSDILEWMLSIPYGGLNKQWELLSHPVDNMLEWQAMRDRKKGIRQKDIDFIVNTTFER